MKYFYKLRIKYISKVPRQGNQNMFMFFLYSDTLLWSHVLLGKSDHWQNPPIWSETSKTMGANCPQDGPHTLGRIKKI